jgi:chromosome segregation protein
VETDREKGEERISLLEEKKKKAQENTEEIKQELLQQKTERAGAEEDLKKLSETLGLKQQDITKIDKACQISQEKLAAWGARRKALRDEYFQKLSEHTEIKNEESRLKKETELILRQEEKLHGQLSKEETLLQQKEKKQQQQKKAAAQTQHLIKEREIEIGSLQKALNEILSSAESLQNKISELKDKKEQEVHHLQALEKLEKKERSTGTPADIPGALGLLADLIEADAEQVPLIDIFWEEEAKALLIDPQDMMKTLAGRELKGNFLLLSPKGKETVPSALSQDPRVIGLLKAYIRPSKKIKDCLSHLQEAAVVRDVKSAIQLWIDFPSLNYITPRGDVLLSSGLLKLGAKKEGIFTLGQEIKKVKENIARIDKEIEPVELKLKDKMEQKNSSEDKIQRESTLLSQQERKIEEIEKENTYDQTEREKIKINIDILKKELAVFSQDRKVLTKKTEVLSLTIKTLENEEDTLNQNVEEEEREYQAHQEKNEKKRDHFFEIKAEIDLLQEKIKNLQQQREALNRREEALKTKMVALQKEIRECEEEKTRVNQNIKNFSKKAQSLQEKRKKHESNLTQSEILLQQMKEIQADMEKDIEQLREDCEARKEERVKSDISKAEADRDLVNLEESCWQDLKKTLEEVKESAPEEKYPDAEIEERLSKAEENLQKLKSVNLMAEEEYLIQKKRHDFLILEKRDLRESIDTTREAINKIDHESKDQFMKALTEVNKYLQEVFSTLFNGGTAEVKLIDPSHPLESGVEIVAQPPGKKVQNLSLLSGGEKSLTSLAFSFALFRYKPTPFCILDEVDAALDEVNLVRFLELMKKTKNQTQFIIITHNTKTVEVSDYIYGTTMEEPNVTSLYSIKLEKKEKNLP